MINESLNIFQRLCFLGIGLMANLETVVAEVSGELEEQYRDLIARGAQDHSELAQGLRHSLDNGILTARDLRERVTGLAF